jgi:hypothetical protein
MMAPRSAGAPETVASADSDGIVLAITLAVSGKNYPSAKS